AVHKNVPTLRTANNLHSTTRRLTPLGFPSPSIACQQLLAIVHQPRYQIPEALGLVSASCMPFVSSPE
ncbi:hypothetical protein PF002_g18683, partial [Phytophthora fragariae]